MIGRLDRIPAELVAGVGVLALFFVILVPLPTPILDLLLVVNMVAAFLLVVLAVTIEDRARLSVFPTVLLGMTLGRLALNVASTRLILSQGAAFQGVMVRAFGGYVLTGSYGVGVVLFSVLVAIQYFVVAKGSERVGEVRARFQLDGLPIKQVGIEALRQDHTMSQAEAEQARNRLQQESDFFGSLDGASKFVKGETMLGMLITVINFTGGVIFGVVSSGLSPGEAVRTFCLLTVGDGLVGMVPSMMVAVAAGLVITRTEGQGALSLRVLREFLQSSRAVGVAFLAIGSLMAVFGLFSGVSPLGFLLLAVLFFSGAALFFRTGVGEVEEDPAAFATVLVQVSEEARRDLLRAFPDAIEHELQAAAKRLLVERGLAVETPCLVASEEVGDRVWRVLVRGVEVGEGELDPGRWLALHSVGEAPGERLPGDPDADPLGSRPALLISPDAVGKAVQLGYDVMNPVEVLAARISNVLLDHAEELLGIQETEDWLEEARRRSPAAVRGLGGDLSTVEIQGVLRGLLAERISIRARIRILDALCKRRGLRGQALLEAVRAEIGRVILDGVRGSDGILRTMALAPALELELKGSMTVGEDGGDYLGIDPDLAGDLFSGARARSEGMRKRSLPPCLVVSRKLRPHLRRLLAREVPDLFVLAYEEAEGCEVRLEAHLDRFARPDLVASAEDSVLSA